MPAEPCLGEEVRNREHLLLTLRQHLGRLVSAAQHLAPLGFALATDELDLELRRAEGLAFLDEQRVETLVDQLVAGRLGQRGHATRQLWQRLLEDPEPVGFLGVLDLRLDGRPRSGEFRSRREFCQLGLLLGECVGSVLRLLFQRRRCRRLPRSLRRRRWTCGLRQQPGCRGSTAWPWSPSRPQRPTVPSRWPAPPRRTPACRPSGELRDESIEFRVAITATERLASASSASASPISAEILSSRYVEYLARRSRAGSASP